MWRPSAALRNTHLEYLVFMQKVLLQCSVWKRTMPEGGRARFRLFYCGSKAQVLLGDSHLGV